MRRAVELSDVHNIVLIFKDGRLVIIDIQVVRSGEDGHDTWESGGASLAIHSISSILSFVSTND